MDLRSKLLKASLERVEQHMEEGLSSAHRLKEESGSHVLEAGDRISGGLQAISKALGQKVDNVERVLHVIESIGKELNLLAINAAIEAAHAGERGATFSVVADKVRDLANEATQNAKLISEYLDLKDLRSDLDGFESETVSQLSCLAEGVRRSSEGLVGMFADIHGEMSLIRENNDVAFEVLDRTGRRPSAFSARTSGPGKSPRTP